MAFEICQPRPRGGKRVKVGFALLDASGNFTPSNEDAKEIGLRDRAVLLIDTETKQIGVRAPKEGELDGLMVKYSLSDRKAKRKKMLVRSALSAIGLDCHLCKGIYAVTIVDSILSFTPEEKGLRK